MKKWLLLITLIWTHKSFYTVAGAIQFLNQLPEARSLEAKVFADKSVYRVYYRIEEELPEMERRNDKGGN